MKPTASLLLFIILSLTSFAQDGIPFISYFEECTEIEVENWSVCQDMSDMMLFANRQGLLTYDGYRWEQTRLEYIPTKLKRSPVDGKIYMGANNNYGILEKTKEGKYRYLSLSGDTTNPGLITDILFTDTTIIFYSDRCISVHNIIDTSDIKRWRSKEGSPFTGLIAHQGKLFFNVYGEGLFRLESDTLFPLVTGYLTANREILFSLPYDNEKRIIGTSDNKLQLFDRIKYYEYEISRPEYLEENILSDAVIISDSLLAISTLYGGILVVNRETGDEVTLLNYQNGLPDDEIYAIGTDNNHGLWLTHGYGICRVDFNLPVSSYNHYPGLEGMVTSVLYHNGKLYAGTNEGLFMLDQVREYDEVEVLYRKPPSKTARQEEQAVSEETEAENVSEKPVRKFFNRLFGRREETQVEEDIREEEQEVNEKPQPQVQYGKRTVSVLKSINYIYRKSELIDRRVRQIIPAGKGIITVSSSGLYYVEENYTSLISSTRSVNYLCAIDNERILVCSNNGLSIIELLNGQWKEGIVIDGVEGPVYNAVAVDSTLLWFGSDNRIASIKGRWTDNYFTLNEYFFPDKYPVEYKVAESADSIYGFSDAGIFLYSAEADSFRLYNNADLGIEAGNKYDYLIPEGCEPVVKTGEEWKCLNTNKKNIARIEKIIRLFDDPDCISIDDKGSVWITDKQNRIYRIDDYKGRDINSEFKMYISGVRSSDNDYYELDNLVFGPDERAISVSIKAPYYLKETSTMYQYFIEDHMKTWSAWSLNPDINIFLESGDYKVRFRAMNILGEISEEKTVSFYIKPPFTRSAIFFILCGILIAGFFVLVVMMREKKLKHDKKVLEDKVRERTLEIEQKKEQIERQRDEIINQKEEITSSITYASRIQTAMLPDKQLFRNSFSDYFILFKPRDIVSGDFYWVAGNKDRIYFTAADCTGHGVPGAFMSMLGISLLNEITSDGEKDLSASEILGLLRSKVIMSLSHTSSSDKAVDGLDIAFCKYDREKKILEYAGAFNPLYHFRKGVLTVYKANRMPVGYHHIASGDFTNNRIKIQAGDLIYIFSDGYIDQFGGPDNKKFSTRQFKSALSEVADLPMDKQYSILEKRFMLWKGKLSQVDDVILIGIKF